MPTLVEPESDSSGPPSTASIVSDVSWPPEDGDTRVPAAAAGADAAADDAAVAGAADLPRANGAQSPRQPSSESPARKRPRVTFARAASRAVTTAATAAAAEEAAATASGTAVTAASRTAATATATATATAAAAGEEEQQQHRKARGGGAECWRGRARPLARSAARVLTYVAYDAAAGYIPRDSARVVKVLAELGIDELAPPPPRAEMTLARCLAEYLAPCALSSLFWFVVRRLRSSSITRASSTGGSSMSRTAAAACSPNGRVVVARALWTVVHRMLRQALICRLFFKIGSRRYNLATILGLVCCFFREEIFHELHRLHRWPAYFSLSQGCYAVLRTLAYTAAFLLPLQRLSVLLESPQRRGNIKKLLFSVLLASTTRVQSVHKTLRSNAFAW